ncbi:MAG: hypothetical protein ACXVFF_06540 [Gaiellaceae bacterium]
MSLLWAGLVVALAVGLAVSALLFVRRRAPDGSFFADGDRAAGVFGVLATGFSVLLGLIVFLAFTSYDTLGVLARERRLVGQSGPLPSDASGAPAR